MSFILSEVNPCYPDPCTNGGTCKTIAESFNCACPLGRLGEFCEGKIGLLWPCLKTVLAVFSSANLVFSQT